MSVARPRVGFLGVGWIGRNRMQAIVEAGAVEAVALAEPSDAAATEALALAPGARRVTGLDDLLNLGLDGVVIATPSAHHAEQSIRALQAGAAVFCQKPLGRTGAETRAVVEAAQAADRLLSVDMSYRFTEAAAQVRDTVRSGTIGKVFAADLTFHNAYGPDKPWAFDRALSGGGCVIDLGVHLVDLALWTLDFPDVVNVSSQVFANGSPLFAGALEVENYAVATLTTADGTAIRLACSWKLHAGADAIIAAEFHGTEGGAILRNLDGSFYDLAAEHHTGSSRRRLVSPPDLWGGRAAVDWARRLAAGERFHASAAQVTQVAEVLDRILA